MANEGLVALGNVQQLLTEINTELAQRPIMASTVANQICWVRTGGGTKAIGQKIIYTVPMFGNRAKKRTPYEEVGATLPELAKFSQTLDIWEPEAQLIPKFLQATDLYGVVEDNAQPILAQSAVEMETQLADMIGLGASTAIDYDGNYFFDTVHECNPNRKGLRQFSNYKVGFDCTAPNIALALDYLDAMPGPDGNLLSMPGENYVIVSTGTQEKTALEALNGQIAAVKVAAGDTAGTSVSNAGLMGRAKVLKLTQLRNYFSGKGWLVVRIADAKHRPFAFTMALPPQMYLEGVSIDEHTQTTRSVGRQGWKSIHSFGTLWPQLAVLCIEN